MRIFFLGNQELTRCGSRSGSGEGGFAYFCQTCGVVWGRVVLGRSDWLSVHIPCRFHGRPEWGKSFTGGSFLYPLIWWDGKNGTSLSSQLAAASPELIRYEAEIRASHTKERMNAPPVS